MGTLNATGVDMWKSAKVLQLKMKQVLPSRRLVRCMGSTKPTVTLPVIPCGSLLTMMRMDLAKAA